MKNIHVLPTDKPSRLSILNSGKLNFGAEAMSSSNSKLQYIYITSDEKIKEGDWVIQVNFEKTNIQLVQCVTEFQTKMANDKDGSFTKNKIILTTDQDLIADGIQAIDDEFLEWFVKNPSCEFVGVTLHEVSFVVPYNIYKIIIPQEEPKQETLEEAAKNYSIYNEQINKAVQEAVKFGAEWQAERMYSEEEVVDLLIKMNSWPTTFEGIEDVTEWFEQFKNKGGDK